MNKTEEGQKSGRHRNRENSRSSAGSWGRNDVWERAERGATIIRGYITSYHLAKTHITGMRDSSDVARARTCNYTKRSSGKESARRVTVAE